MGHYIKLINNKEGNIEIEPILAVRGIASVNFWVSSLSFCIFCTIALWVDEFVRTDSEIEADRI